MHDVCSSANDYSVVSELMDGWGLLAALTKNTHLHTQSSAFCGAHNVIRAMLRDCLPLRFELFFSNAGGRCCAEQQTCMWLSYMSHTAHGARREHDSKRSSSTAVFWTYNDILLYTPTVCVYILRSRGRHRDATVTHTTQVEWPCAIHPSIHPSSHLTEHYTPHTTHWRRKWIHTFLPPMWLVSVYMCVRGAAQSYYGSKLNPLHLSMCSRATRRCDHVCVCHANVCASPPMRTVTDAMPRLAFSNNSNIPSILWLLPFSVSHLIRCDTR